MRGFRAGVSVLAVVAALAMTGCGPKPTTGAQPSAAPSASPSPAAPSTPNAGECHNLDFVEQTSIAADPAVPCEGVHYAETVAVGEFTGEAAAGKVPLLVEGSKGADAAAQNTAYLDCSDKADAYLGHSWIHPLVSLRIVVPDNASWQAGQHWYRCDLYEIDWAVGDIAKRTSSLKKLEIGAACFDLNSGSTPQLPCANKHNGEFAGGFMMPATMTKEPKTEKEYKPLTARCQKILAAYIGVAESKVPSLIGLYTWWQFDSTMWPSGRRAAWCFLYTGENGRDEVSGSAKGRKGKGL